MAGKYIAGYSLADVGKRYGGAKPVAALTGRISDYTHGSYKDRGCRAAPRCLTCPLPMCIHDVYDRKPRSLSKRQAGV